MVNYVTCENSYFMLYLLYIIADLKFIINLFTFLLQIHTSNKHFNLFVIVL